jgi:murein L,D-transpeptidase YafK
MRWLSVFLVAFHLSLTIAEATLPKADKIIVFKSQRLMKLYKNDQVLKSYKIALSSSSKGHKQQAGDKKTPEGNYLICGKNPNSKYHKSLRISYPNEADRKAAAERGDNPGSDIMIHGLWSKLAFFGKAHVLHDWTLGCVAVTNDEIDEVWQMVDAGTRIEIRP